MRPNSCIVQLEPTPHHAGRRCRRYCSMSRPTALMEVSQSIRSTSSAYLDPRPGQQAESGESVGVAKGVSDVPVRHTRGCDAFILKTYGRFAQIVIVITGNTKLRAEGHGNRPSTACGWLSAQSSSSRGDGCGSCTIERRMLRASLSIPVRSPATKSGRDMVRTCDLTDVNHALWPAEPQNSRILWLGSCAR